MVNVFDCYNEFSHPYHGQMGVLEDVIGCWLLDNDTPSRDVQSISLLDMFRCSESKFKTGVVTECKQCFREIRS